MPTKGGGMRPNSLLRLQYLPLCQHPLQQRLHAQFLRDGDGPVFEPGCYLAARRASGARVYDTPNKQNRTGLDVADQEDKGTIDGYAGRQALDP